MNTFLHDALAAKAAKAVAQDDARHTRDPRTHESALTRFLRRIRRPQAK